MKKKHSILWVCILILVLVIIAALFLVGRKDAEWQEQYDLGVQLLLDGKYEQAIIAFNAAIEIDPKRTDAYIKAAEVYVSIGDIENAEKVAQLGTDNTGDPALQPVIEQLIAEYEVNARRCILNNDLLRQSDDPHPYFDRNMLTQVTFLDSLSAAPADAWDFSLAEDGSVLAWLDGTHLYIAGDGVVKADADASELFAAYKDPETWQPLPAWEAINFNGCFDTSHVTDMGGMFWGCRYITALDVSNWDTSQVTCMFYMFYECYALSELDISGFDTRNVTTMSNMFLACTSLPALDVSNFNTKNVKDMSFMFDGCSALTAINVTGFNTSKVTNMCCMFRGCESLTGLDVSSFDTSAVEDLSSVFRECRSLMQLDASNFDTTKVVDMSWAFCNCKSLSTLDISSWDMSMANTEGMFYGCDALINLYTKDLGEGVITKNQAMEFIERVWTADELVCVNPSEIYSKGSATHVPLLHVVEPVEEFYAGNGLYWGHRLTDIQRVFDTIWGPGRIDVSKWEAPVYDGEIPAPEGNPYDGSMPTYCISNGIWYMMTGRGGDMYSTALYEFSDYIIHGDGTATLKMRLAMITFYDDLMVYEYGPAENWNWETPICTVPIPSWNDMYDVNTLDELYELTGLTPEDISEFDVNLYMTDDGVRLWNVELAG